MAAPSMYLENVSLFVRSRELKSTAPSAADGLLVIGSILPAKRSRISVSIMFSPLLPMNTFSAITYDPILSSTLGAPCIVLVSSVALLPPQKTDPPIMVGLSFVPYRCMDTCSASGRNSLRACIDVIPSGIL